MDSYRRGPFVNDDGDIWVPVSVGNITVAQKIAYEAAFSKVRFVNMEEGRLSLHEGIWYHTDGVDEDGDEDAAIEQCTEFNYPCTWTEKCYHFRPSDYGY